MPAHHPAFGAGTNIPPSPLVETPMVAEMTRAAWDDAPAGFVTRTHLHHFHQLDVVLSGTFLVGLEERRMVRLRPGEAFLTPAMVQHSFRAEEPVRHAVFKFHLAPRYWPVLGTGVCRAPLPRWLADGINEWTAETARRESLVSQQSVALTTLCLIELVRNRPRSPPRNVDSDSFRRRLLPLLERIANEPYADWSIGQLAEEAHMSMRHFSRCFSKLVGRAPKRYLLEVRMRAAAGEVAAGSSRPLKEIGERAGYATVHAFTHSFKKFFGVSPGAYRRRPVRL